MSLLVSIILPNYNHAYFLQERLDSIFNQTYQHFEVIVLDDCSTDSSLNILEPYKNHSKVSHFLVNNENTGSPFKQWQKGLILAIGDYIWIAESDDTCDLDFLESQLNILLKKHVDVVVAETKKIDSSEIIGRSHHPLFKTADEVCLNLDYFLYCPILNVSAVVFKNNIDYSTLSFSQYSLIGDRVFYFEVFHNTKVVLNRHTHCYFRKVGAGVSTLSSKSLKYLIAYYKEHHQFAYTAFTEKTINSDLYIQYITRFYNRLNNRLSRKQKLNLSYLKLRLMHNNHLKIES